MELEPTQLITDDDDEISHPVQSKPEVAVNQRIRQVATLHFGSKIYPLFEGINSVGRSPTCDVVIEDITVSKKHAEIEANLKFAFVCDLDSSNKTRLNEEILRSERWYQVLDGSFIKFGMVKTQFFLLRDYDDSIIIPPTPAPVRRVRALVSSASNAANNSPTCKTSENDDMVFAKPSGPSPRRNKMRQIHEMETQVPDQPAKTKRPSIYECETQEDSVAFEEDMSIHEMETQRVDMPSKSTSIHDMETQRTGNHAVVDINTSIYDMETQRPNEMPKKNRKKIHEMATQIGVDIIPESDDELDDFSSEAPKETCSIYEMETQQPINTRKSNRKNIHEVETQVVGDYEKSVGNKEVAAITNDRNDIHNVETQSIVPRSAAIDESGSETDDEILPTPRPAKVKPEMSSKLDIIDSGSDTDEEGLFEKTNSSADQVINPTPERFETDSPILGNTSTERTGGRTPGDIDDPSLLPTQICPIEAQKNHDLSAVSKGQTRAEQPDVDDSAATQILDDFQYAASIKKELKSPKVPELSDIDDMAPTQIIDPITLTKKNYCKNEKSSGRILKNSKSRARPHVKSVSDKLKVKKNDSLDDSIADELNDMFEGENDKMLHQDIPLMTQQLEEILEPPEESQENYFASLHGSKRRNVFPESNDMSDSEATASKTRDKGATSGAAVGHIKKGDVEEKSEEKEDHDSDVDILADDNGPDPKVSSSDTSTGSMKTPLGPRTYSKKPSGQVPVKPSLAFENDSSDDDINTKDILKMVDTPRAGPSTSAKFRKQNFKEALSSMEAKVIAKKRGRGQKNMDDSHVSTSELNGSMNSVGSETPMKKRRTVQKDQPSGALNSELPKTNVKRNQSKTSEPGCSTPRRSKISKKTAEESPSSSVRSRQQHKVIFTGLNGSDPAAIRSAVAQLGGLMVDEPTYATVLITDKVRRTIKFFCAVSRSIPIVSMSWIEASLKAGEFVDPADYLLKDPAAEKKYNFNLHESLTRAKERLLLEGCTFLITAKVQQPPPSDLKRMIEQSGGKCLARAPNAGAWAPNSLIISCDDDVPRVRTMLAVTVSKNQEFPPVVTAECILTGILRQQLDTEPYLLDF